MIYIQIVFFLGLLLLTPGCFQYHKLLHSEFPQAEQINDQRYLLASHFLRSVTVYDIFRTEALFDALLVSPEVQRYIDHSGKVHSSDDKLVVYLLAELYAGSNIPLNEPESSWALHLETSQGIVHPLKISPISTLQRLLQALFGAQLTPHKTAYQIVFDTDYSLPISLVLTSVSKTVRMTWDGVKRHEREHEDFYWG